VSLLVHILAETVLLTRFTDTSGTFLHPLLFELLLLIELFLILGMSQIGLSLDEIKLANLTLLEMRMPEYTAVL
jgi:hypothetical protein